MVSKEDTLRARVYQFYAKNIDKGKSFTVHHFVAEGESRRTIYSILRRSDDGQPPERKAGSGRKPTIFKRKNLNRLVKTFEGTDKVSIRSAASKFKCHPSTLHKALMTKTTIRCHKKVSISARTEEQISLAKTKCGRLFRKFSDREFIIDDESYFTLSHTSINGNDVFYASDVSSTSANVKFSKKKKFEAKVLVWIALSPKGLSRPLIRKYGYAISGQTYLEDCIRARLIPYIEENYSNGEYVFWPDQASSHYAKIVLDHLRAKNIDFVEKDDNPANVPEIRPIENFWAYLKSLVCKGGWKAETVQQLINRIKYCLKNVDQNIVQTLGLATKSRIDFVRRHGVVETR